MVTRESVATVLPFDGRLVETMDGLWTATMVDVQDHSPDAFRVDLQFKRGPNVERGVLLLRKDRLDKAHASDDEIASLLRHAFKHRQQAADAGVVL